MKKYNSRNCHKSNKFLVTKHNEIEKFPLRRLVPHGILTQPLLCSNLPLKLNHSRTSFIYPQLTDHMSFTNPVIYDSPTHTHSPVQNYPRALFPTYHTARHCSARGKLYWIPKYHPLLLYPVERESERELMKVGARVQLFIPGVSSSRPSSTAPVMSQRQQPLYTRLFTTPFFASQQTSGVPRLPGRG